MKSRIGIKEAVKFHGHLGPYLILGVLAGEAALKKLKAKKYFGIRVRVYGANKKPKSCLIDGLQLSTGATQGKGNIEKFDGPKIRILFFNCSNKDKLSLYFKNNLLQQLETAKTHKDAESLARRLYKTNPLDIFNLKLIA
jgi:formylmethanofuran dehydrogenase subunit E